MTQEGYALVVVGGTSGIGRAVVADYAKDPGTTILAIGKGRVHADELRAIHEGNDQVVVAEINMASDSAGEELGHQLSQTFGDGAVDGLVNAAGAIGGGGIEVETLDDFDRVINSNLRSLFSSVKATLPLLKRSTRTPGIVNVSSVCSWRPCTSLSYSAAKAGMDHMTRTLARELAKYGVRVNAINPSVIESNLQRSAGLFDTDEAYEKWLEAMAPNHPLGRIGQPSDASSLIRFLLSEQASWMTGSIVAVDGGRGIA